ncbi:MAG: M61 family peptidase [Acidobacteriota bacterium]|nr:M61 family peptidase [Acidobacteriota bacterium]
MRRFVSACLLLAMGALPAAAQSGPAPVSTIQTSGFSVVETLSVDATEAPRKVFHARMTIPAKPGDFVLFYPKWIPGEHGPTGPLADTAGIYFRANGKPLAWHRDAKEVYAFHVEVPDGVKEIEASLDYLSPVEMPGGFSSGSSATDKLAVLAWNWLALYPLGMGSDQVGVKASLKLPAGWTWASALPEEKSAGDAVDFKVASLTTLVDSPVQMGQYQKKIPLQVGQNPPHELDIAADSAASLRMQPQQVQAFDNLVAEAGALYGARHYRDYHFLLTLSDHVAHFGLEHHESDDSRLSENYLTDANMWTLGASLLPHEYTHSWNGKYRRPAGLATPDYSEPMEGNLLWVYEGLTEYFGYVLTARSGLQTADVWRDHLANLAMTYTYRPGRDWRPLEDTATDAQQLYGASAAFSNYRRSVDYYDEGALIWLEVDTILRRESQGKKSMDDFAHLFHGGENTVPMVKTYTFDDVVSTLNQVQPYDWRGFLTRRILNVAVAAPLQGIENSGWKLVYTDKPNRDTQAGAQRSHELDTTASLGLLLNREGAVVDAIEGGIAAKGGIGPGMKVVAVNGRRYSPELLTNALLEAQKTKQPIQLLIENTEYYRTVSLAYFDGPREPHLVRDESKPDLLDKIIQPKVTKLPAPFTGE